MKVATFNANSIRNRLDVILQWMDSTKTDVLCVQETKCQDKDFPRDVIQGAGYDCAFSGQKTFNGVAIISSHELKNITYGSGDAELDEEARFISAEVGDVLFVNTYIPQGQSIGSEKFARKLRYLDFMYEYFSEKNPESNIVWCGDFNIAFTDLDVYDPDGFRGGVGFCEEEQSRLQKIMDLGLCDTFRQIHPDEDKAYTFWDYRAFSFKRNLGWRLDYIMTTEPLTKVLTASEIDKEPRKLPKSSDHTFLLSEFNYFLGD